MLHTHKADIKLSKSPATASLTYPNPLQTVNKSETVQNGLRYLRTNNVEYLLRPRHHITHLQILSLASLVP